MYSTLVNVPLQTVVLSQNGDSRLVATKDAIAEAGVQGSAYFIVFKDGRRQTFDLSDHSITIDYSLVHQAAHSIRKEIRYQDNSKRIITTDGIEWIYDGSGKLVAYDDGLEIVYTDH